MSKIGRRRRAAAAEFAVNEWRARSVRPALKTTLVRFTCFCGHSLELADSELQCEKCGRWWEYTAPPENNEYNKWRLALLG